MRNEGLDCSIRVSRFFATRFGQKMGPTAYDSITGVVTTQQVYNFGEHSG